MDESKFFSDLGKNKLLPKEYKMQLLHRYKFILLSYDVFQQFLQ